VNHSTGYNLGDKHLVDKVLGGDTRAFAAIVQNTERLVAQIVFKMISNPEDRKDMAQDIYLKVYNKLPGFKFEAKLSTWIAQISYNTCLDHLRKKKLVLPGNLYEDNENDEGLDRMNELPAPTANEAILLKDRSLILKTAIEKLSPVYQTLISLYHNEELSYEEIGQITGLPEGTVKSYLFRARKALKNSLLDQHKKEDI
jgi:RNA polymerase sigma-70 factor (ECF subfamily)